MHTARFSPLSVTEQGRATRTIRGRSTARGTRAAPRRRFRWPPPHHLPHRRRRFVRATSPATRAATFSLRSPWCYAQHQAKVERRDTQPAGS
eukprot:358723-Chlamydomonas_euryale.AAC.6